MRIGVPTEIKANENRIAIVPAGVEALVTDGHEVFVQRGAGLGSGISDDELIEAGAKLVDDADELWAMVDMIVKVKEPLPAEYGRCRKDLLVFTYFHFAAARELTDAMIDSGALCFTYETLEIGRRLPLLTPMSEVAGRMAIQVGAHCLEKAQGGRGVLLGGVPGVDPANVLILGGGVVGTNAAKMAAGMGAHVTIMDIDLDRLRYLDDVMPANVTTVYSSAVNIRTRVPYADLLVGAVLLEGARAPTLVPREYLALMREGAVIVDVAVDQGGCVETIHPTTHANPTYVVDGVVHYGVANMPGAVSRTSTYALTNATLPWVRTLARMGGENAVRENAPLRTALNVWKGKVTHRGVAEAFDMPYVPAVDALA
ncbi:MAG: alanine dehydrogenase [Planctomycetes bacterium]|nr:alanine dehydrogenase [Planctomycetota bacterium]MCB9826177.1 alanine dehydrogenase [Planctomycetota bacterium]MCB9902098.1 alanine dehydrogenase [Planctomycetota bacterium]